MKSLLAGMMAVLVLSGAAWGQQKIAVTAAEAERAAAEKTGERPPNRALARQEAQREAMKALAFLDGEWRGAGKKKAADGWTPVSQTARVGLMLDGTLRMIEVASSEADGTPSFSALRLISFDPAKGYLMRSYQGGGAREYPLEIMGDGFAWEIGSRGAVTRYETRVRGGAWVETATRTPKDGAPDIYLSIGMMRSRAMAAVAAK